MSAITTPKHQPGSELMSVLTPLFLIFLSISSLALFAVGLADWDLGKAVTGLSLFGCFCIALFLSLPPESDDD